MTARPTIRPSIPQLPAKPGDNDRRDTLVKWRAIKGEGHPLPTLTFERRYTLTSRVMLKPSDTGESLASWLAEEWINSTAGWSTVFEGVPGQGERVAGIVLVGILIPEQFRGSYLVRLERKARATSVRKNG